jgi:hypothetical protein
MPSGPWASRGENGGAVRADWRRDCHVLHTSDRCLVQSRHLNVPVEARTNVHRWPAVRVHPPRRKAAVEDSNVSSVERSRNWCSRPGAAIRPHGYADTLVSASLRQQTSAFRLRASRHRPAPFKWRPEIRASLSSFLQASLDSRTPSCVSGLNGYRRETK